MTLSLTDGDVGSTIWPEPFRAIYIVTFARTLSLRLAVQNRARHRIVFEEALHTYFAISDISDIAISGLAGTTYIDKTDAARRKPQTTELVTITAETDRVYLDTPGQCVIEDRGWRRRVVIEKSGAASTVVWNPWAEKAAAVADLGDPVWRGMGLCRGREYRRQRGVTCSGRRAPDVDGNFRRHQGVTSSGLAHCRRMTRRSGA